MAKSGKVTARLDHILLGVPDVEEAADEFEHETGVRPIMGGEHPGFGTSNALVSLSDGSYVELIGPGQEADWDNIGGKFAVLEERQLVAFAMATSNFDDLAERVRAHGFEAVGPIPGARATPDGERLEWQMLLIGGHDYGGFLPILIDWGDTPHPATTAPTGLSVARFEVRHPEAAELARIYGDLLGAEVDTVRADHAMLDLVLDTPKGRIAFRGEGPLTMLDDV
jgi:hypothetical protein